MAARGVSQAALLGQDAAQRLVNIGGSTAHKLHDATSHAGQAALQALHADTALSATTQAGQAALQLTSNAGQAALQLASNAGHAAFQSKAAAQAGAKLSCVGQGGVELAQKAGKQAQTKLMQTANHSKAFMRLPSTRMGHLGIRMAPEKAPAMDDPSQQERTLQAGASMCMQDDRPMTIGGESSGYRNMPKPRVLHCSTTPPPLARRRRLPSHASEETALAGELPGSPSSMEASAPESATPIASPTVMPNALARVRCEMQSAPASARTNSSGRHRIKKSRPPQQDPPPLELHRSQRPQPLPPEPPAIGAAAVSYSLGQGCSAGASASELVSLVRHAAVSPALAPSSVLPLVTPEALPEASELRHHSSGLGSSGRRRYRRPRYPADSCMTASSMTATSATTMDSSCAASVSAHRMAV